MQRPRQMKHQAVLSLKPCLFSSLLLAFWPVQAGPGTLSYLSNGNSAVKAANARHRLVPHTLAEIVPSIRLH